MPERPEIRALSERLHEVAAGGELQGADVLQFSSLKTVEPRTGGFPAATIDAVTSVGKYVVAAFVDGRRALFHLSQGGRVDVESPPKMTKPRGAVLRLRVRDRPSILVKECGKQRKAGGWVLAPGEEGPLTKLGPEVLRPEADEWIRTAIDNRRVHTHAGDYRTLSVFGRA